MKERFSGLRTRMISWIKSKRAGGITSPFSRGINTVDEYFVTGEQNKCGV